MKLDLRGAAPGRRPARAYPPTLLRSTLAAAAALALAGCASFSADGGMSRVSALTQERTGHPVAYQRDPDAARARVAELLQAPLSADAAAEVALLDNRGLQQRLGELGVSEAELVQAGRLRNPAVTLGRLAGGGALEIDRSVMFDVLGLLTLPSRSRIAQDRFDQAQRFHQRLHPFVPVVALQVVMGDERGGHTAHGRLHVEQMHFE